MTKRKQLDKILEDNAEQDVSFVLLKQDVRVYIESMNYWRPLHEKRVWRVRWDDLANAWLGEVRRKVGGRIITQPVSKRIDDDRWYSTTKEEDYL